MGCLVAILVVLVAASGCVLGVSLPYSIGSGAAAAGGQAGAASTSGRSSGSSQASTLSGAQPASQFGTGANGAQPASQFGTGANGAQPASQFGTGANGALPANQFRGTTASGGSFTDAAFAGSAATFGGVRGVDTLPGASGSGAEGGTTFPRGTTGQGFASRVIQQEVAPTVTQTVTIDTFTTLTDIVFQSFEVTLTQFVVQTATRPLQQVVVTPVDDFVAIRTTVVHRPESITLTETKTDFRLAVRTSVTHVTLTHTSYAITHVPFTITATETVHITSPVVRTVISTQRRVVTDIRTLYNTVYVHGYY